MANSVEALWVSVRSYEARKTSGVSEQVPLSHRCAAGSLERRGAKKGGGAWLGQAARFEIVKTRTVEKKRVSQRTSCHRASSYVGSVEGPRLTFETVFIAAVG